MRLKSPPRAGAFMIATWHGASPTTCSTTGPPTDGPTPDPSTITSQPRLASLQIACAMLDPLTCTTSGGRPPPASARIISTCSVALPENWRCWNSRPQKERFSAT